MKLGSGTTLIEVSKCLGYYASPIKLSELVKHPNLNKWSGIKPIIHVGAGPNTKSELQAFMASAQWGLDMTYVTGTTDEGMWGEAITESKNDPWKYSGITVTQDYPGRLGDFRWYNTDAECPFNKVENSYNVPGVEYKKGPVVELSWSRNNGANVEIDPYDYTLFRNKPTFIVYRKVGSSNGLSAATSTISSSFTGMTSGWMQWTSAQTGTYEACAVIYRDNAGEMYPLPETYTQFTVRNMTAEEYSGIQVANYCDITLASTVGQLTVKMSIRNITDSSKSVNVACYVYDSRNEQLWYNTGTTFTVAANTLLYIYGNENMQFVTTDPGTIRVEDIQAGGTFRPPLYAEVRGKNNAIGDSTITKTKTIYST